MEDLEPGSSELLEFDILLVSAGDYHYYQQSHDLVGRAEGYAKLAISHRQFPPFRIVLEDKILILAKKSSGCSENK